MTTATDTAVITTVYARRPLRYLRGGSREGWAFNVTVGDHVTVIKRDTEDEADRARERVIEYLSQSLTIETI